MVFNMSSAISDCYILITLFQTDADIIIDPFEDIMGKSLFLRCYDTIHQELPQLPIRALALKNQCIDEKLLKKMDVSLIRIQPVYDTVAIPKSENFIPGKILWAPIPADPPDTIYIITSPFTISLASGFWSRGVEMFFESDAQPVVSISEAKVHPCNLFMKIVENATKEEFYTQALEYKGEWFYDQETGERRDAKTNRILNRRQDFPHIYAPDGALLVTRSRSLYELKALANAGKIVPYSHTKSDDSIIIRSLLDIIQLCQFELSSQHSFGNGYTEPRLEHSRART